MASFMSAGSPIEEGVQRPVGICDTSPHEHSVWPRLGRLLLVPRTRESLKGTRWKEVPRSS
jgi:hypothetical protein